jgi:hypothetical protein
MTDELKNLSDEDKEQKIQTLRDMITTAEQTMQSAKAMLLQLEGKKKVGRRKKLDDDGDGTIIQGTFDGQIMIGTDGKQYPIPANYASKSKLVEGDFLKLSIVGNGQFIYKQIGPVPRQNKIGIVGQDASGNYFVAVDGKPYKVLLASITYFDVQPGDQVAIVTSQDENAQWASIEALLQSNDNTTPPPTLDSSQTSPSEEKPKTANAILTGSTASTITDMVDDVTENDTTVDDSSVLKELKNEDETIAENDTESDDTDTLNTGLIKPIDIGEEIEKDAKQDEEDASTVVTGDIVIEDDTDNDSKVQSDAIVDEWIPDIDEIEKEIRAEMQ